MNNKKLFVLVFLFLMGCSEYNINKLIYRTEINEDNYLININKIHKGMTQKQVIFFLGTPLIKSSFSSNIWYYVFNSKLKNYKIQQNTLILKFNKNGILIYIKNMNKIL
ncbi:outer membrane protein assembly factor BamE [Pantoea sp. SoEX]|uniref:outer membrane protein assembly factor BamE n=1 Tax=Pantoea sp. SoEX TaxID=2576763 RepID=UPI001359ABEF|nr:outer membrane protein assembly factor BamE [Pantoea sp. SoEX]MXP50813.1 outer membrane protein assembly factor BamE [Pantoea sp. SoEX]